MNTMNKHELLSALADGQLSGAELAEGLDLLDHDDQAVAAWQTWHLIGDVMRSPELAGATPSDRFMSRLSQRLAAEAAPQPAAVAGVAPEPAETVIAAAAPANDPVFRWKLVAGFASVAAAVAVGWTLLSAQGTAPAGAQLAAAPAGQQGLMIRDAQLDEMLAAHRQLGDATALQVPGRFLRNATFEGPAR